MGSHPLSEPWLSHLENGNDDLAENGLVVLVSRKALPHEGVIVGCQQ